MGYTHYFGMKKKSAMNKQKWASIIEDTKRLLVRLPKDSMSAGGCHAGVPIELALEYDLPDKRPALNSEVITFNGVGEMGHETFCLEREKENDGFDFCKTHRKPYDLVVCAVLIVVHTHAPGWRNINSDGDLQDWVPALHWVREVLGEHYQMPLEDPEGALDLLLEDFAFDEAKAASSSRFNDPLLSRIYNLGKGESLTEWF